MDKKCKNGCSVSSGFTVLKQARLERPDIEIMGENIDGLDKTNFLHTISKNENDTFGLLSKLTLPSYFGWPCPPSGRSTTFIKVI